MTVYEAGRKEVNGIETGRDAIAWRVAFFAAICLRLAIGNDKRLILLNFRAVPNNTVSSLLGDRVPVRAGIKRLRGTRRWLASLRRVPADESQEGPHGGTVNRCETPARICVRPPARESPTDVRAPRAWA
jgi:hypothetical protein